MKEFNDVDVRILPKSRTIFQSFDPREDLINENSISYIEQQIVEDKFVIGNHLIVPNGADNNFPQNYRALLDSVYLGHGIKRTLINLLLSGGIGIYREIKEDTKIIKDWIIDAEITDWLDSFNFKSSYIVEAATDMIYIENCTTQFIINKGARIGLNPKVLELRHHDAEVVRLEKKDASGQINNIFIGEWNGMSLKQDEISIIPMFSKANPWAKKNPGFFAKMPTFGSAYYGRPVDIGATTMLKVLSLLPNYHKANLTERGFKWVVSVASKYYDAICAKNSWTIHDDKFKKWKNEFIASIDEFLIAPQGDKLQTRFLTEFAIDPISGKTIDHIQITKLEDDTKTLSEVGMQLSDTYTIGYVSANSLHPQLANVNLKNQSLSGSNLREAYEMHIKTSTPTMRELLLHPVNTAIKMNWPSKNLKIGFMDMAFQDFNKIQSTTKTDSNVIQQKQ